MAVHKPQKFVCIVDENGNPIALAGASGLFVQGPVADGGASTANPVIVGGVDAGGLAQTMLVTSAGSPVVDTELPAAAALADDTSNPTVPGVGAYLMCWDKTDWSRVLSMTVSNYVSGDTDTILGTGTLLHNASNDTWFPWRAGSRDSESGGAVAFISSGLWNGTNVDRLRGNLDATVLASAASAVTRTSADQTNYNHRGVYVILNVTANPGGAETLSLAVQIKDPVSGTYIPVYTLAATATFNGGATGYEVIMLYPGISEAQAIAGSAPQPIAMPRTWRVVVTHSAAGSWTYSVSGAGIM